MNWFDAWWSAFVGVVAATWPDIPAGQLFMDVSVERRDWNVLLDAGEMSVPWVVVTLQFTPLDDYGPSIAYQVDATIYYITSLKASATQNKTAAAWITSKLVDLQRAFLSALTVGTVDAMMPIDVSAMNPANASFLNAKIDFQAGSITIPFTCAMLDQ
jgi:hypothetical protein